MTIATALIAMAADVTIRNSYLDDVGCGCACVCVFAIHETILCRFLSLFLLSVLRKAFFEIHTQKKDSNKLFENSNIPR